MSVCLDAGRYAQDKMNELKIVFFFFQFASSARMSVCVSFHPNNISKNSLELFINYRICIFLFPMCMFLSVFWLLFFLSSR